MPDFPAAPILGTRRRDWQGAAAALLLAAATAGVFARTIGNHFTWWDDQKNIHHNPQFNPPTGEKLLESWKRPANGLYIPLTHTYWGALAMIAESKEVDLAGIHLDPRVYHAGSLALHIAAALVVLAVLRMLGVGVWPAAAGALIFAIHPVQVEAVAWASGAKDVLCGLLSLCAIHQYLHYVQLDPAQKPTAISSSVGRRRTVYLISGIVLLVLAMLAKPAAMVVPLLTGVLDLIVLRRPLKKVAIASGLWLGCVLPLAAAARFIQSAQGVAPVAWWQRPLVAADAMAFYISKLVWPAVLAPDYGRRPEVVLNLWGGWWGPLVLLTVLGLGICLWRVGRQHRRLAAGMLVVILALSPVLGLTPFMFQYMSTVADHYLYLPMLGVAIVAAGLCAHMARGRMSPRLVAAAVFILAGAMGFRSAAQLRIWKDDLTLWEHTAAHCPDSFVAPNNIAANYGRESLVLADMFEDARTNGDTAAAFKLQSRRRELLQSAVALLERSLAINGDYPVARLNAFVNCMRLGKLERAAEHIEGLFHANDVAPLHMRDNFTTYHHTAGIIYMKLARYDQARRHFEELLRLVPDHLTARADLATARAAQARLE